jgi:hypothetical protein
LIVLKQRFACLGCMFRCGGFSDNSSGEQVEIMNESSDAVVECELVATTESVLNERGESQVSRE